MRSRDARGGAQRLNPTTAEAEQRWRWNDARTAELLAAQGRERIDRRQRSLLDATAVAVTYTQRQNDARLWLYRRWAEMSSAGGIYRPLELKQIGDVLAGHWRGRWRLA